ncbi:MAG TPA: RNA polymerase factor sigma-32 [bacterium]|jgi:RNA polymerase sigma-32 factor
MSTYALTPQTSDLTRYLNEIARHPLLSKEEEYELAMRVHDDHDLEAAQVLVLSNLRFVVKIAKEYSKFSFPLLDLIQEGNIGLMHAVKRFDPYRGFRLLTYAVHWIRAFIKDYIIRNWSLVKLASARVQKKLFFHLVHMEPGAPAGDGEADGAAFRLLAEDSRVQEEITRVVAERVKRRDLSLDLPSTNHEGDGIAMLEFLPAGGETPDEAVARQDLDERVREVVEGIRPDLNDRELYILDHRLMADEPLALQVIGDHYGVSRERVRQVEVGLKRRLAAALGPLATAGAGA